MRDAIEVNRQKIKCDADGCDHIEELDADAKPEDYLNVGCPKCGAVLMDEKQVVRAKAMMATIELINKMGEAGAFGDLDGTEYKEGIFSTTDDTVNVFFKEDEAEDDDAIRH